jgi:hypothetical protein
MRSLVYSLLRRPFQRDVCGGDPGDKDLLSGFLGTASRCHEMGGPLHVLGPEVELLRLQAVVHSGQGEQTRGF